MSWRQFELQMERDRRRSEREAMRHYREAVRRQKEAEKRAQKEQVAEEVARFESYLEVLQSLHKESGPDWNWEQISKRPPPQAPRPVTRREDTARRLLAAYKPGFFARLFGSAQNRLRELKIAVTTGKANDDHEFQVLTTEFADADNKWKVESHLAADILVRKPEAYRKAISHAIPFDEIEGLGSRVSVTDVRSDVIAIRCMIPNRELIPDEELKLTASGKLSAKPMPPGRQLALLQDHVCSTAIRIARECFALLPVPRVIVNMDRMELNTSTGFDELITILAVHFTREALERINPEAIDPSDAMRNFGVRMKFKKTDGFEPVDPITPEDQWVTT